MKKFLLILAILLMTPVCTFSANNIVPEYVSIENTSTFGLYQAPNEIILYQGKIGVLISQTPEFGTPRGIHEGSPIENVFREYGTDYKLSYYENEKLYEYFIYSADGTPCLLRFAVRNSEEKIYYISVRVNH